MKRKHAFVTLALIAATAARGAGESGPVVRFSADQPAASFVTLNESIARFQSPLHPPNDGIAIFHEIGAIEITDSLMKTPLRVSAQSGMGSAVVSFDTFDSDRPADSPPRAQRLSFRPAFSNNKAPSAAGLVHQLHELLRTDRNCRLEKAAANGRMESATEFPDPGVKQLEAALADPSTDMWGRWTYQCGNTLISLSYGESRFGRDRPDDHGFDVQIHAASVAYEQMIAKRRKEWVPTEAEARAAKESLRKLLEQSGDGK